MDFVRWVGGVVIGDPSVEIPAVVIEPVQLGQPLDLLEAFSFQMAKADHHVRYLNTGVVDVVLNFDGFAAVAKSPDEGVAERRVAEMTDVGRFVGIDVRVLDDGFTFSATVRLGFGGKLGKVSAAVEVDVQIAGTGNLHLSYSLNRLESRNERFGNFPGRGPRFSG